MSERLLTGPHLIMNSHLAIVLLCGVSSQHSDYWGVFKIQKYHLSWEWELGIQKKEADWLEMGTPLCQDRRRLSIQYRCSKWIRWTVKSCGTVQVFVFVGTSLSDILNRRKCVHRRSCKLEEREKIYNRDQEEGRNERGTQQAQRPTFSTFPSFLYLTAHTALCNQRSRWCPDIHTYSWVQVSSSGNPENPQKVSSCCICSRIQLTIFFSHLLNSQSNKG